MILTDADIERSLEQTRQFYIDAGFEDVSEIYSGDGGYATVCAISEAGKTGISDSLHQARIGEDDYGYEYIQTRSSGVLPGCIWSDWE